MPDGLDAPPKEVALEFSKDLGEEECNAPLIREEEQDSPDAAVQSNSTSEELEFSEDGESEIESAPPTEEAEKLSPSASLEEESPEEEPLEFG